MSKPVPYLADEAIERDAALLLAEYAQARGIVIASPIPIEDIEALDAGKLEQLGRYEVHLDRKLERILAMLLRLKDLRQRAIEG